jgi:hypothetical protein
VTATSPRRKPRNINESVRPRRHGAWRIIGLGTPHSHGNNTGSRRHWRVSHKTTTTHDGLSTNTTGVRSIGLCERPLRRSVDAVTPHEVGQYGLRIFRKGFLLCAQHIPTSVSPSRPRHPWGPVASAAARFWPEYEGRRAATSSLCAPFPTPGSLGRPIPARHPHPRCCSSSGPSSIWPRHCRIHR